MQTVWQARGIADSAAVADIRTRLNDLPEALARALVLRGVDSADAAKSFFRPALGDLHDPFLMTDMHRAATRLADAIEKGERVLIYGDYDVDGTTSTALLTSFLRGRGVEAHFFVPHRLEDGYGLGQRGIDRAHTVGASLIIALDCGITAIEEARYARTKGIDLIICDHHLPGPELPDALAVLNPKRADDTYPFDELTGCAIGFKLVQATVATLGGKQSEAEAHLDLVALSTASDFVPLVGENRVLMREGIRKLGDGARLGIRALAAAAALSLETCDTRGIVFGLAPRINAAGRMGHAEEAVRLLLATDEDDARAIATSLEKTNKLRRETDIETADAATVLARRYVDAQDRVFGFVLYDPAWHPGVVGIVASRIVERFHRPAVILTEVNGVVKGSARSVSKVDLYKALSECKHLLADFGGHKYAAGLSLQAERVDALRQRFGEAVSSQVSYSDLSPTLLYDATLRLSDVNGRFWSVLRQFAPHGPNNQTPVFVANDLQIVGMPRELGARKNHLKFNVREEDGARPIEVVAFGRSDQLGLIQECRRNGSGLQMLFSVGVNEYRGRQTLQLRMRDARAEG